MTDNIHTKENKDNTYFELEEFQLSANDFLSKLFNFPDLALFDPE